MGSFESFSHAWTFANAVGNSINKTELWRKILVLVGDPDDKQRLLHITQRLVVHVLEVLSNVDLLIVVRESLLDRIGLEVDVGDEVASLIAPLSDNWLADKFKLCDLLELVIALRVLTDLVKTIEASFGGLELEDVVDGQHATHVAVVSRSFEA